MMPLCTTTILPVQSRCGMGVLLGRTPVGGPAGVADAVGAVQRLEADGLFQVAQLALGAADLQPLAIARHGNARRVVTAVFQPFQAVQDYGHNPLLTNVSDNATHGRSPLMGNSHHRALGEWDGSLP